jgi:hypothetical protein
LVDGENAKNNVFGNHGNVVNLAETKRLTVVSHQSPVASR